MQPQHRDGGHRGHDRATAGQPRPACARRHCWLRPGISHPLGSSGRGHASACQGPAVIRWAQGLCRRDSLVQCYCEDTRGTESLCVPACPWRQHLWSPIPESIGDGAWTPSPAPGHSGDGDSWPALSQAGLPLWLCPCLQFMLLLCRSGLSTALPPRGQLLEGPPHPGGPAGWGPLQGGCLSPRPDSP